MRMFLGLLIIISCTHERKLAEAPAWVDSVRNGEETIKLSNGNKTFYRRIAGSQELSRESSCNLAIIRAEEDIKKELPFIDKVPYTVEVVYYDAAHADCAVTISINNRQKYQDSSFELTSKADVSEDEATEILRERARIAARFALTGITKTEFETFAKEKVSLNIDTGLCTKFFLTQTFSVHGSTHVCWQGENVVGFCTLKDSQCWTKTP